MAKKEPCKNHPEKLTAKRCYHCKQPICQTCQKNYFHHLFCSYKHAVLWRGQEILTQFKPKPEIIWFILVVIISNVILFNVFLHHFNKKPVEHAFTIDSTTITEPGKKIIIDSLRNELHRSFKVDLKPDKDLSISVTNNRELKSSRLVKSGETFQLDIPVNVGDNVIVIRGMDETGRPSLIDSFAVNFHSFNLEKIMAPVYTVRSSKKEVALTFDGGSNNIGAQQILDILKTENIHCTMFLTGQFVKKFPNLVREIIDNGHEVGNHTLNHPHLTTYAINGKQDTRNRVDRNYLQSQLNTTDSIFYSSFKTHMAPFWRAPFGEINKEILFWAAELGYRHIGWSPRCDSWDWVQDTTSALYRSAGKIEDHFLELDKKKGLSGCIILMHLGSERTNDLPYTHLKDLIDQLRIRGYDFVKVSNLLRN